MFCLTWVLLMRRSPIAAWTMAAVSGVSQKAWMETRGTGSICGMLVARGAAAGSAELDCLNAHGSASRSDLADRRDLDLPAGSWILAVAHVADRPHPHRDIRRGRSRAPARSPGDRRPGRRAPTVSRSRNSHKARSSSRRSSRPTPDRSAIGRIASARPPSGLGISAAPARRASGRRPGRADADSSRAARRGQGSTNLVDDPAVRLPPARRRQDGDPTRSQGAVALGEARILAAARASRPPPAG